MDGLTIADLTVQLPGAARPVLDSVSLSVSPGQTVGLVGESGSGKSVTARAAVGLLPRRAQVSGSILVGSREVVGLRAEALRRLRASDIAMIFQNPRSSMNPVRRIGDFMIEAQRDAGMGERAARGRALELLDSVAIRDPRGAMRRYPYEYSGGMLQRVMIAAALMGQPKVLLADEPTTALDVTTQSEVIALLMQVQREHRIALLLITHNLDLAAAVCDRVSVMYAGRILASQPAAGLPRRPLHPYAQALIAATPRLGPDAVPPAAIRGRPLSLADPVIGCAFAPRCERATHECELEQPPLLKLGEDLVACWNVER